MSPILEPEDALLALRDLEARVRKGSDKADKRRASWLYDLAYDLEDLIGRIHADWDKSQGDHSIPGRAA